MSHRATADGGLSAGQWGVLAFLLSEAALFSTLIVTYLMFDGQDARPGGLGGPTPAEVLSLPLASATTTCLLASSLVAHVAERSLRAGRLAAFAVCCAATLALGGAFLAGTAHEWHGLIENDGLTISRNLFGTTFFTLVGLHALHVSAGLAALAVCLTLVFTRAHAANYRHGVRLVVWYWHFVDVVWVVVFLVVYARPLLELRMAT
jgi:cytochrome c oxidase subunit 3/cytochrome o ubiquinol oxidase subunit 3